VSDDAPTVADLTDAEQRWVAKCVRAAMDWAGTGDELPSLAALDALAVRRMAEPESATVAIDVLGCAIGEHIRRAIPQLEWKVVTDDYGTAIALYRARGHLIVVPQSSVSKRWDAGRPFVVALVTQMIADLERIAAEIDPVN
jgi:hypothetical protein